MKILPTVVLVLFSLAPAFTGEVLADASRKRILFIDSYHQSYPWSAGVTQGIRQVLDPNEGIELKIHEMDTKRNPSESFKKEAALKAKALIETWKPDVVIASDDNASKYLIVPYFKDAELPFVFCGVNWDASPYGFPFTNVTGMVEVALLKPLVDQLKQFSRGNRLGFLGPDMTSTRQDLSFYKKFTGTTFTQSLFVKNLAEWKAGYLKMQGEVDMLILPPWQGIPDWNDAEVVRFLQKHTTIPSGTMVDYNARYTLAAYAKVPAEQGRWAATTALAILGGHPPAKFPITANKQARIVLNMNLAKKLGVRFPMSLIENAHLISARARKVLFINSYHAGYTWSDDVEKGFRKAMRIQTRADGSLISEAHQLQARIFRMDTKNNRAEGFIKKKALQAKALIDEWKPDIVIASDDNAAKYLIAPYLKNTDLPVVFCGINWDATIYGFPCNNVTGILEVEPVRETIALMTPFARGKRLGFIGVDTLSAHRMISRYRDVMAIPFADVHLVNEFGQWQKAFLTLQQSTDMILMSSMTGIKGWREEEALRFIQRHVKVPIGGVSDSHARYSMFGHIKVAEEQGWEAGKMALAILDGASPTSLAIKQNRGNRLFVNMPLVNALGLKLSVEFLQRAPPLEE
ncbi:MAG: ABC transporter substrate-binding protein [Planctomycetota bacterium]